jgi:MOSC domain-containing protein YiiM
MSKVVSLYISDAGILTSDIMPAMVHKTGLRAQIISGGEVSVGDALQ